MREEAGVPRERDDAQREDGLRPPREGRPRFQRDRATRGTDDVRPARPGMRIPPPGQRLRNVRFVIEYDGTRFKGWQVQANARTVAGAIEKALEKVIGERVRLVGAGRTDEGVHAEGQVANFLTHFSHPLDGLPKAVNDELPEDVAIVSAEEAGPQFHARHSATSRVYRYVVTRRRSPFLVRRSWIVPKKIVLARMNEATALVVGFHDFSAFTDKRLLNGASTKVDVTYAGWKDVNGQFVFRIAASHFLPRMVRRLVGCLVRVGMGDLSVAEFKRWLETGNGDSGPLTAPAMGLVLEHVEYPAEALTLPAGGGKMHPLAEQALAALDEDDAGVTGEDDDSEE